MNNKFSDRKVIWSADGLAAEQPLETITENCNRLLAEIARAESDLKGA